ncbi:putative dehydrogenase [Neobacillus cucumis]|nr:putative dehydrogenase [Neobacillus cucumis]
MYQFHPQHQRVRDIITSGEIGDVKLMRSSFSFYLESRDEKIRVDKIKGGGSIYDVGATAYTRFEIYWVQSHLK